MRSLKQHAWKLSFGTVPLLVMGYVFWLFWPAFEGEGAENEYDPSKPLMARIKSESVEAVAVKRSDLSFWAEATGTLKAWRETEVSSEAVGTVVWKGVEEGQYVEKDDILVRLDDRDRRIEFIEAEADLLKVRAGFAVSFGIGQQEAGTETLQRRKAAILEEEASFQRATELFDQGLLAKEKLARASRRLEAVRMLEGGQQDEVQAATAGLVQAEQRLERARLALSRTEIAAPFPGQVADVKVEIGQRIGVGDHCLILLDESRIKVEVNVLEADIVLLRERAPARVRIPSLGDRVFEGMIHAINPRVDPATGTGRVTVALPNTGGVLMPGLFAYVSLETQRLSGRLQVPVEAILERQGRQLVFRIEDGQALWTYVETGVRSSAIVEIIEGLDEGDQVAVADHFALAHETPVDVVDASEGE